MLKKLPIDAYMLMLIGTVALAAVLPASGQTAYVVSQVSYAAVALLFFLYGAKLKLQAIWAGISNWRLQGLIFLTTYAVFPLLGLGAVAILARWMPEDLLTGLLFLVILPSTVQSSIALTSMAGGNVPGAICAASLSNMAGVVLTPVLAALILSASGLRIDGTVALRICAQILLPFILGQLFRPLIGGWIERHKGLTMVVDRGSILLIVYSAFSAGMVAGVWSRLDPQALALLVAADLALLLVAILLISRLGRMSGLSREDQVSYLFCGAQKSLASGVPIANILFAGHASGLIILPLLLYHQFQLFVSVGIAKHKADRLQEAQS